MHGIAHAIGKALPTIAGVTLRASLPEIEARIHAVLDASMAAERAIETEAQQLLTDQVRKTGANIDEARAFQLIKKELAKKKGFTL